MSTKMKPVSFANLETYTGQLKTKYARKADIPTAVSALDNDAKYQTEQQVTDAINAKLSSTYKPGGSVAFADLPAADAEHLGMVYNVTDKFTTTAEFVEGEGVKHGAGANVAVVQVGEEYKYDVMSGFVDLSGLATSEDVANAVAQAGTATDEKLEGYVKTADMEEITAEEIESLFADEETPQA